MDVVSTRQKRAGGSPRGAFAHTTPPWHRVSIKKKNLMIKPSSLWLASLNSPPLEGCPKGGVVLMPSLHNGCLIKSDTISEFLAFADNELMHQWSFKFDIFQADQTRWYFDRYSVLEGHMWAIHTQYVIAL